MERAIFVTRVEQLNALSPEYTRLYFGAEFCERRLPECAALERAMDFARERGLRFTFVTPFLTAAGMDALKPLIDALGATRLESTELVINDYGLLHWVQRECADRSFALCLGRLLTKQSRDPRLCQLEGKIGPEAMDHFKMANVDVPLLSDFLRRQGVRRLEFDNPHHGLIRKEPQLPGSLYVPFVYLTTTRLCPTNSRLGSAQTRRVVLPCSGECQQATFLLKHRSMPADLILKGNTIFVKNDAVPDGLPDMHVNRIVFQPEVPV